MPPELTPLVTEYGWLVAIVVYAIIETIKAAGRAANASVEKIETETKQDNTITDFAVTFNAERRERQEVIDKLQESNNHLQNEVFEIRLEQAKEAGRREEMRITNDKNEAKIVTLEVRIQELEKHQQQSTARIQELEAEIELLNKRIAEADKEIALLQAQKRELENLLEKETNRANALSELVTRLQTPTPSTTQPIPDMRDVDDTYITEPKPVTQVTPETEVNEDDAA